MLTSPNMLPPAVLYEKEKENYIQWNQLIVHYLDDNYNSTIEAESKDEKTRDFIIRIHQLKIYTLVWFHVTDQFWLLLL